MKLSAKDIAGYLAYPQKTAGALVYGLDEGQVCLTVRQLAENWCGPKEDALARIEFSADKLLEAGNESRLADELAAMSLMAEKRVILVRDAEDKLLPLIEDALKLRASGNFLIVFAAESLAGSKLRAWAEKQPDFGCVPCYKDEGESLDKFLRDTLRAYGLKAGSEVIHYLARQLGGDRQILLNELEKLSLYVGDEAEEITLEAAIEAVGDNSDAGTEALCKALAEGDRVRLCQLVDKLISEGTAGVVIVRAVMRYLHKLRAIAEARASGQSLDGAIDALRPPVFWKQKPELRAHAGRWGLSRIDAALDALHILERDTKLHHEQARIRLSHTLLGIATSSAKAA